MQRINLETKLHFRAVEGYLGVVEAHPGAMEAHTGALEACPGALEAFLLKLLKLCWSIIESITEKE